MVRQALKVWPGHLVQMKWSQMGEEICAPRGRPNKRTAKYYSQPRYAGAVPGCPWAGLREDNTLGRIMRDMDLPACPLVTIIAVWIQLQSFPQPKQLVDLGASHLPGFGRFFRANDRPYRMELTRLVTAYARMCQHWIMCLAVSLK